MYLAVDKMHVLKLTFFFFFLTRIFTANMAKSLNDEDETEKVEVTHTSLMAPPNLDGDWLNFFLLIALYTMQGMTLGVAIAIPFLLQAKKDVSYGDQVHFVKFK